MIIPIVLALSINACGLIIPHIIPFRDLPQPTGPFNVGTQIFEWEDTSREEWFTEESDDFRRLVIQVWYPTLVEKKGDYSYLDYPGISITLVISMWVILQEKNSLYPSL